MSEATPNIPNPTPAAAQKVVDSAKSADLSRLAALQREYEKLKVEVEDGVAGDPAVAAKLKRKGAVVREMDVLKRKHDIQPVEVTAATVKPIIKP